MGLQSRNRDRFSVNIWPGFVDALTALLLIVIFVLSIFMVVQVFLQDALQQKSSELTSADTQLDQLSRVLSVEQDRTTNLSTQVDNLTRQLLQAEQRNRLSAEELTKLRKQAEETLQLLAAAQAAKENLEKSVATQLNEKDALLAVARAQLLKEQDLTTAQSSDLALRNAQLSDLRTRLATLQSLLDSAQEGNAAKLARIDTLGTQLNEALAKEVSTLQQFRSEFFGRMRKIMAGQDNIKIVGDRFVFQSELLFDQGSARLGAPGRRELTQFAGILRSLAEKIPSDIDWILRIDGHTDRIPVNTKSRYRSNWELSQARALSVVRYLVEQENIPPGRLAPAGFGEYQPVDNGDTPTAFARNRRIELKFTER